MTRATSEPRSSSSRALSQHSMLPARWLHLLSLKQQMWISSCFSVGGLEGPLTTRSGAHWWPGWTWLICTLPEGSVRWNGECFWITKLGVAGPSGFPWSQGEGGKAVPPPQAPWPSSWRHPGQVAPQLLRHLQVKQSNPSTAKAFPGLKFRFKDRHCSAKKRRAWPTKSQKRQRGGERERERSSWMLSLLPQQHLPCYLLSLAIKFNDAFNNKHGALPSKSPS